jgi:glycosyltransferase involved in cell wall biosynthesis
MSDERPTILIDLRMVRGKPHGIARYASALAEHLPAVAPDLNIVPLLAPGAPPNGSANRHALSRFLSPWEQVELPLRLLANRVSLFHATSFAVPRFVPAPLVLTLHDAIHLAVPGETSALKRAYYRHVVRPAALGARAIITVSSFSRDELVRYLDLDPARFHVIPNGVDERFSPPSPDAVARVRERYQLPARFALYVGNLKPHKNIQVIVRTAERLRDRIPVVLVGEENIASSLGPRAAAFVRSLGVVPDVDLPALYGACTVFVFPSMYEGAGLPPLEAMACGAAVISSNAASMPEVLGDAAATFAPDDDVALAGLLMRAVEDPAFRDRLASLGPPQAARYRWRQSVEKTAEIYRKALS